MTESDFTAYLELLLGGDHRGCSRFVQHLLDRDIRITELYALFQRSLYRVGELWEQSQISVATEHLATSITGSMLTMIYPKLFASPRNGKRAVIACVGNELHEIGAKMIADTFELHGWDSYFLGADTPVEAVLTMLEEKQPQVLGLSVSMARNLGLLNEAVRRTRVLHPRLEILVGGQAVLENEINIVGDPYLRYLSSLDQLNAWIASR